jgi:hypothetical protein
LRAAAVLAAMVLVFTATPARALFVRGWEALRSLVAAAPSEPPATAPETEVAEPDVSSVLRFTPHGPEFRLEFLSRPQAGTLVLSLDSVPVASAGIIGGEASDEMILLPDGLRVRNSATSTASYEVQLPLSLSVVELRIAGSTELRLEIQPQSAPLRRELDLSGRTGG